MRYLVIGGAGFIGSYISDWLMKDTAVKKVIVYDNFCSGKKWHISHHLLNNKFELIEDDIRLDLLINILTEIGVDFS